MHTYVLERAQEISRPRHEIFEFFGDALNLESLTPPFLRFRVLTPPPIEMRAGALIEYRLSLLGIRFSWKTGIEEWSPEHSFVDVQLSGPYSLWRHEHEFEEIALDRTLVTDRVHYGIPYGFIGRFAHWLFVGRLLGRIFDYRAMMMGRLNAPAIQSDIQGR